VITSFDSSDINKFKQEMKSLFQMSDLGVLSYYLGIKVQQGLSGWPGLCPEIVGEGVDGQV
jgi:hypothetical protein